MMEQSPNASKPTQTVPSSTPAPKQQIICSHKNHPPDWQQQIAAGFSSPSALLKALGLKENDLGFDIDPDSSFKTRVPRSLVARMEPGNKKDPLLLQVLAKDLENEVTVGFVQDPVAETTALATPGLLHKYTGRALLVTTGACAVHCRYCFRRHFPYPEAMLDKSKMAVAFDYIAADTSIEEIILSGGDPLVLSDEKILGLIQALNSIKHLKTLRIHTRTPVVIPARVTTSLLSALNQWQGHSVVVLHVNHPAEINEEVKAALQHLGQAVDHIFNQSVFLAQVNDEVNILKSLSEKLFACGVLPYYIHALDPVQGAAHFAISDEKMKGVMEQLRALLPGYLVPRLVREVPNSDSKQPL